MTQFILTQKSGTLSAPSTGRSSIYAKNDGLLYFQNADGQEGADIGVSVFPR